MDDHTSRKRQCKEEDKKPHPATAFSRTQALPRVMLQPKRVLQLPFNRSITDLSASSLCDVSKPSSSSSDGSASATGVGGVNNNGWDDENFDYIITPGEMFFNGRYRIKECIGKGSFGQVVRAEDIESKREVAIKIIKSKPPFLKQSQTEIALLEHLRAKDPDDQHNIVRLLTHFMHRNHQCLVFEMMSMNLYQLLKNTQFGGVPLHVIQDFALHLLTALSFLARDDVDIIHCDLKPENILLRHPNKTGVKVIDFGSSCHSSQRVYSYIQSRSYRAPEVLLGLPYTAAIDMWSLGCILVEMHTGAVLFPGLDRVDQMQKIVKLLGMVPDCMLEKATDQVKIQFFQRNAGDGSWSLRRTKVPLISLSSSNATTETIAAAASAVAVCSSTQTVSTIVPSLDPIASLTKVIIPGVACLYPNDPSNSQRNYTQFIDLIYQMLTIDPRERIKPVEALKHPFLASLKDDEACSTTTTTTTTTTPSMASTPQKRKMDSLAPPVSNHHNLVVVEKQRPKPEQQQQPNPVARREPPSILERLRRVFG